MKYMNHVERGFLKAFFGLGCLIGLCLSFALLVFGWPFALLSYFWGDEPSEMTQEEVEIVAMYQTGMLVRMIAQERGQEESTIRRILADNRIWEAV